MRKTLTTMAVILCGVCAVMAQQLTPDTKLRYANNIIGRYYVDSIDQNHVVEEAIVAMLKTLDPHSQYSNPEETRELTEPLEGNFSGIGIQFNMATDTLYVIQTVSGGPSEKVGILAGDRIVEANDTLIAGVKMKNSQVMKLLRGPKGTKVKLKVLRKGVSEPLDFVVVRDDIPIYSVDAVYMAAPEVGYIKVNRFAEGTGEEVYEALKKLKKKGMKHLILDLDDNGGGYLNAAVEIAEMLLDKDDLIVYTKGDRVPDGRFNSRISGVMPDGRVVVMVNQYSASASEILSGAVQDHDRGVIVGRRTFGKGLVQRPFPFPDGSMIRLTVARYYTPSGRCIQKPYSDGDDSNYAEDILHRYRSGELSNADSVHINKAEKFTTDNGRVVYGGGGIMPDRFVPIDTTYYSDYYRDLVAKGAVNRFCMEYVDKHRSHLKKNYRNEEAFVAGFEVTDEMMDRLKDIGEKEGVEFNAAEYERSEPQMRLSIKGLIGRDLFEQSTYHRVVNAIDPSYNEALRLIQDEAEYKSLLTPVSAAQ